MLRTHMPFLFTDRQGNSHFFFCRTGKDDAIWKLHYFNKGRACRLATSLPPDMTECSPTVWQDELGWHVTFIAGGGEPVNKRARRTASGMDRYNNRLFCLYRMDGEMLDRLPAAIPVQPARSGFIYKNRIVWGEYEDMIHVQEPGNHYDLGVPGAYLYRLSYSADNPDLLLVSGEWKKEREIFSIEYNLKTKEQNLVIYDGQPAYKQAIGGGQAVYACRGSAGFEDRRLKYPREITRVPIAAIARVPSRDNGSDSGCGCTSVKNKTGNTVPSRPSCLECVEKHLGAAYVLLTESRDGYASRLRAVGHLFEAEDESQTWPVLHDSIRQARIAYQRHNHIPLWHTFETMIKGIKANFIAEDGIDG